MKKEKVGSLALLIGACIFFGGETVYADSNTMSLIEYDIELLEDGTGVVTERRTMDMSEGTELYIEMNNLQGSEVTNFYVDGYAYNPNWDIDDSREEKAGEYGVIETDSGMELVWGIGEYGEQDYELTYTITNMVRQLEDGQALNWDFNTYGDIPPEAMQMEITGPFPFSQENTSIWGFGYDGLIEFEDGQVVSAARTSLEENSPLVVLMQFENAPFAAAIESDLTLEEQLERSQEGATYNDEEEMSKGVFAFLMSVLFGVPTLFLIFIYKINLRKKAAGKMATGAARKRQNKGQTYEDIPYKEGELIDVAYFLQELQHGTFEDYFFAYLLKWSKEERIKIHTVEVESFFSKEETVIQLLERHNGVFSSSDSYRKRNFFTSSDSQHSHFKNSGELPGTFEQEVWSILEDAADLKGRITESEMKKWSKKNAKALGELASGIKESSKDILLAKGYIREESIRFLGMTMPFVSAVPEGDRLFDRITQFENHLNDLESDESLAYRQTLPWEDFIIWATLYGKGSEVVEKLEALYPEQWNEWIVQYPYFYGGYHRISGFSHSMSSGMQSGGYNASTGAGGSTSIGGGGGAMGGGGGGAR